MRCNLGFPHLNRSYESPAQHAIMSRSHVSQPCLADSLLQFSFGCSRNTWSRILDLSTSAVGVLGHSKGLLEMGMPTASIRDLARRLVAMETASQDATIARVHEAVRVCEKLQVSLARFAGSDGFKSLLRRALALARAEDPSLENVKLKPDGSLDGCEALEVVANNGGSKAAVVITANLLGLLETFIGEPLTLRLVREAWPDTSLYES